MKRIKKINLGSGILTLSLVLLVSASSFASELFSGRSVGMGGAYTQVARGVEAVFWNPANLGFCRGGEKSLMLASFGINARNNSFTLKHYNQYSGKFLTSEDKQTILSLIPSRGLALSLNADVLAVGVSWGNFALTVSGKGTSDLLLPKDPVRVLFFGNEINDTILLSGSDGEVFASVEAGLGYGRPIFKNSNRQVLWGINVRYIQGFFYQKMKKAEGGVFTLETGINGEGDFLIQSAEGGRGYGLDFGLALRYSEKWTFGLSLFNLLNRIRWDERTERRGYQVRIDSLLAENFDVDSLVTEHSYTETIPPFTTRLPTSVQAGIAYQGRKAILAFDIKKGGTKGKLSASFGTEYEILNWLKVRAGVSIKENQGMSFASGLGLVLGGYSLDLGVANQNGLWVTHSKGISLAISNRFHF